MILQRSIGNPMLSSICRLSYGSSPSCILPLRHSSVLVYARSFRIRSFGAAAAAAVAAEDGGGGAKDTFFAAENVTWGSIGVSNLVAGALSQIGLHRPSLVQAACIPSIFSGADTVVSAETGSGKTHGYLVPLFDMLCRASDDSEEDLSDGKSRKRRHQSLVLCPNVMLCEQVVRMANCLLNENGEPLLSVAAVCGRQGWPSLEPDVIVSTPVALLNYLYAIDPERSRRSNFIRAVKYIVFDEADLLLCGSFQNQVVRIIDMLRFEEKQVSRLKALENANPMALDDSACVEVIEEESEDVDEDVILESDDEDTENDAEIENVESQVLAKPVRDWRRVRKTYRRSKQYIFVAATLPVNGKQTAGGVLKRLYPDAQWITGNYVHRHNPRLEQKWIEVNVDTQVDTLISAVKESRSMSDTSEVLRTMIFANTVDAVEAVANILTAARIECYQYHSNISLDDRTKNLTDFQQRGGVFVCTDAASRGLDVPNVSHVIQAEFATSAVDFLHRVGRTARAGQPGVVTSFYTKANRDLVAAIRQAETHGQPVENAFSRKRGFRNKLKKRSIRNNPSDASTTERVPA